MKAGTDQTEVRGGAGTLLSHSSFPWSIFTFSWILVWMMNVKSTVEVILVEFVSWEQRCKEAPDRPVWKSFHHLRWECGAQTVGSRLKAATCRIRDAAQLKEPFVDFGTHYQTKHCWRANGAEVKGRNTETRLTPDWASLKLWKISCLN